MSLASSSASAVMRRCICQPAGGAGPRRYASAVAKSDGSSSVPATVAADAQKKKKPSMWQLIQARAQKAAINVRPALPRQERELERRSLVENGEGSIFKRMALAEEQEQERELAGRGEAVPSSSSGQVGAQRSTRVWAEHKTSTGNIKHSPRKLNDVARLIAGKPIDAAILQMQMSDKRIASTRIKSMLALARDHATMKGLKREELVVREAWVSKGVYLRRLDIKGRGRHGIIMKPEARMHVVLAPGLSRAEQKQKEFDAIVKRRLQTGGAGYALRTDRKIINLPKLKGCGNAYAW